MNQRRVRGTGRQIYGRAEPLRRPRRSRTYRPKLSFLQQRIILMVVVIAAVTYGLSRLFAVQVVMANPSARQAAVMQEATKLIRSSVWQGNILTLDGGALSAALQRIDPTLQTVVVQRKLLHTVIITTTLRQPSLGWATGDQDYLLDINGTAISSLPAGSRFPVVTDGSNLPVTIGQQVAPEQFVTFVSTLVPALKADGYTVTGLSITDTTFDLTVSTDKGYQLIFDTTREVGSEISDLKAVGALLVQQHKTPTKYIDLRIAGKAYWQ